MANTNSGVGSLKDVKNMSFSAGRFALFLLEEACRQQCSDIHLLPKGEEMIIQFRVQGERKFFRMISASSGERLISHFKFQASLDIGERRKPQSGSFDTLVLNSVLSLRISTLPATAIKESLVVRILPQTASIPIERLSLFSSSARSLRSLVHHAHGMILFSGPTGSGKTTTLYSLIHYCSHVLNRNIITLEDPIEKKQDDILQVQINEKAGITYASGLKAVLRHDPDMIVVGEIRDAETAKIAVRAALSGHLVLSTVHARNAEGALYRMRELDVSMDDLKQTLIGVTAQRLIRLTGPQHASRASVYELLYGKELSRLFEQPGVRPGHQTLKTLVRKGVALGYVSSEEFLRFSSQEIEHPFY